MIIIISSKIGRSDIAASLGKPEYSYYFLLKEFVPALEKIGTVVEASDHADIDHLFHQYTSTGEDVIFLSFSPPQQTPLGLDCPTIPVFAWEFDNTPDEAWDNDPRNNWSYLFTRVSGAITLSEEAASAVRNVAGVNFPILVAPAPVWDRFCDNFAPEGCLPVAAEKLFSFTGKLLDSSNLGLSADGLVQLPLPEPELEQEQEQEQEQEPEPVPATVVHPPRMLLNERWHITKTLFKNWWIEIHGAPSPPQTELPVEPNVIPQEPEKCAQKPDTEPHNLQIRGTVYTTVLNPGDHRKNLIDLISAFCWAFKETPDVTLIVKMTHHDIESYRVHILTLLSRLAPFQCRVLIVHGFLDDAQYKALIAITSFYVNASVCEGLCLPLMEFLTSGKPALAPNHTAMHDYLNSNCAFILQSSPQPASWPHDPSGKLKTRLHRLNWESLMNAYRQSFEMACHAPSSYAAMSKAAHDTMRKYCTLDEVTKKLLPFLQQQASCKWGVIATQKASA